VGGLCGSLFQFCLSSLKVVKNYGKIGVGEIFSIDIHGDLAVIGGNNDSFVIVNIKKREVVTKPKITAFGWIYSLRFCQVKDKLLLIVGGKYPDYSQNKTDIFEIITEPQQPQLRGNSLGKPKQIVKEV
jgi:hypothetical protein